jgi:hypothetical protein
MNATMPAVDECIANIEKSNAGIDTFRFNCWSFTSFLMGLPIAVDDLKKATDYYGTIMRYFRRPGA